MTDNLERPAQQEILEWQKDEFLGDILALYKTS